MRILFVSPTLGTGGSEQLTVTYAVGMKKRGHETCVAYAFADHLAARLHEEGIPCERLSERRLGLASFAEWVVGLRSVVERFRPQVVHAQSVKAAFASRVAAPSVPQLVTVHGISEGDEAIAALLLRATSAGLLAVSDATADGIRRHAWAPPVDVLPPGVDTDRLRLEAASSAAVLDGSPALCCVARQEHEKGTDVLLRALPFVLDELGNAGLTVVGGGTELEANRKLACDLGVGDRVTFLGLLPSAIPQLAAADAVVLPSRREGLPVVALEALALERPVVATDVGGTGAVVREGETGWLVTPESAEALAAAIVDCVSRPAEARRRAVSGAALVADEYGTTAMLNRLEEALRRIARRGSRVPRPKPRVFYEAAHEVRRARAAAARARGREREWRGVRILGYHRVAEERDDVFAVAPDVFRGHMEHLRRSGATILPLETALDLLDERVEEQIACVTFDDGYRDNLEYALPVLDDLQIPATVFVVSGVLDGKTVFDWYARPPAALTVDDVRALVAGGLVDVQAHSRTHPQLTRLHEDDLVAEVAGCKHDLEEILGRPVTTFSYPAGIYGARELRAVREAGFRAAVTTRPGVNAGGVAAAELRRTMIRWGDGVDDFAAKLDGLLDAPSRLAAAVRARRVLADQRAIRATARLAGASPSK